jgi:hypothetical protein
MGFMRKALFVSTGGLSGAAGVKANSKKERVAKATEKQLKLQQQALKQSQRGAPATVKAQSTPAGHKPALVSHAGPHDPWLNEVSIALSELGYSEVGRNTSKVFLAGVPIEGNVEFIDSDRQRLSISVCESDNAADQGERMFRAKPDIAKAIASSATVFARVGRIVCWANGQGKRLDESSILPIVDVLNRIHLNATSLQGSENAGADIFEQLRQLGELRDAGIVTSEEFESKKAELLSRV